MAKLGDMFGKVIGGPLKALLPKSPWLRLLLIGLPILIVLALLEPVLRLFETGLGMVMGVLTPMLETPAGRLLLLNIVLLTVVVLGFFLLRSRLRQLRSGLMLRRHLDGLTALVQDRPRRARERFAKVAVSRAKPPHEYPAVCEDAKLKLARMALQDGDADKAVHWLTRVRDKDLPTELQRSLAQLRGMAFLEQGQVELTTLATEIRAASSRFSSDVLLLGMLRDIALRQGDRVEAIAMQERVLRHASPRRREAETKRMLDELLAAGEEALANGQEDAAKDYAKRARKVAPDAEGPTVLLGKAHLARGDARAALREWGRSKSPAGLEEVAKLLDSQPGVVTPRELLEACPVQGAVLLAAREYARRGDSERAIRAARAAVQELGPSPSVAVVLAEVLERCGRPDEAKNLTHDAVRLLIAPP